MGTVPANRTESQVKAAVLERLLTNSYVDAETVLVSEMTVAGWARRADIVLANGRLWGFEIKSDADCLTRLPGQLNTFISHFEKFTIVAADRFESRIKSMIPDNVGLWIISSSGKITQKIPPRCVELKKEAYLSFLNVRDLRTLLAANGFHPRRDATRKTLMKDANELLVETIAQHVRSSVKARYRALHNDFLETRKKVGTAEALRRLQRKNVQIEVCNIDFIEHKCNTDESFVAPNGHPYFVQAPGGPVLKRKVV